MAKKKKVRRSSGKGSERRSGKATAQKKKKKKVSKKEARRKGAVTRKKTKTRTKKTAKKAATRSPKKATKKAATKKAASRTTGSRTAVAPARKKSPPKKTSRSRPSNRGRLEKIRQTLLEKKEALSQYLQSELSGLESADKHHLADLEEMASDIQDTDSVCEIMEVGASTLEQVEQALNKIDEGTYGLCEDCGDSIPFERLEALPFATLCVGCKRKQELLRY